MRGPSGVVALVLAETAVGGSAVLWLAGFWTAVKRGFFILTTAVALGAALLATVAAGSGVDPGGQVAVALIAALSVVLGLSLSALILRWMRLGRALGLVSLPVGVAALVALARLVSPTFPLALVQLLAGAAFMGAVTDGLLLGHWYLVDRRLPRDHIRRAAVLLLVAVALEVAAVLAAGFGEVPVAPAFSPLLGVGGLTTWLALGMVGATALIAVLIRASLRGGEARAVQAATGFFYLAVITAFAGEMAAKVRFTA
ncbi:MAG TPA: hypothetical protein VGB28_03275 [Actinomycetota bacterium]